MQRRPWLLAGLAALGGVACLPRRTPAIPMQTLHLPGPCPGRAPALLVLLPGAYSTPDDFIDERFVEALQHRGAAVDVVLADAHAGYFAARSVLQRLREDVIAPARARGYGRIWLVGISLGGFAALGYASRLGDEISGVVALAPYLGPRSLQQEIVQAGGPQAWRARGPAPGPDDLDREIWAWLAGPRPALPVYLGYGRDDRFAPAHALLSTLLPPERVDTAPGGHDWPAWRSLWSAWLDRGLLPADCGRS